MSLLCHRWTLISHSLFVYMHNSEGEVAFCKVCELWGFRSLFFHLFSWPSSLLMTLHKRSSDLTLRAVIHLFNFTVKT